MTTRNRTTITLTLAALSAMVLLSLGSQVWAAPIFSEDFSGITDLNLSGDPAGQIDTTLDLGFAGNLAGWNKSGSYLVHAVDTNNTWTGGVVTTNPRNWGVMIWQDNVITQQAEIAGSNEAGIEYRIDFLAAGAIYEFSWEANQASDGLKIDLLLASNPSTVVQTFNHMPGAWAGTLDNLGLTAGSFQYTGDGTGDILFRVSPVNANQGRFQGTIDDLKLTVVPEPTTTLLAALGLLGLLGLGQRRRR